MGKGRNLLTDLFRAKRYTIGRLDNYVREKVHQFAALKYTNDLVEHAKFDFHEPFTIDSHISARVDNKDEFICLRN